MQSYSKSVNNLLALVLAGSLFTACSFHKKKYENPITKDTLQPDKVLFDRSIGDIEKGRFEVARLTLNTLINTYDTSEYLAKAKLAIADSWYREGGAHGLAQAEAEYKDFILFYPAMEEAAESQWKVCQIHYKQMEKADRDSAQAIRTEDECRVLVTQFPNSKYIPQAQQMLRDTQEVLGQKEFLTGAFYHTKGAYPAAANRHSFVADQYPLFSGADEALWQAADSFRKMGDRFEAQAAEDYTRIVRDYPLSAHAAAAKDRLEEMKRPVPTADPAALARMKYEAENRTKKGMVSKSIDVFSSRPDAHLAAKTGPPVMTTMRPPTPVSVPAVAAPGANTVNGGAAGGTTSDVTATATSNTTGIDSKPDARQGGTPAAPAPAAGTPATGTTAAQPPTDQQQPLPTNRQLPKQKKKSKKQIKLEEEQLKQQQAAAAAAAAAAAPATPAPAPAPPK
jgi:outer membrane protein assembly factor BamD